LPVKDALQRGALFGVGAVVDQEAKLPVPVEYAALKMDDEHDGKPAELHVAEVPLANEPAEDAFADPVRGIGAEHAGTADRAVAEIPPVPGNTPIGCGLPFRSTLGSRLARLHDCPR
jgi:hypothetical protein